MNVKKTNKVKFKRLRPNLHFKIDFRQPQIPNVLHLFLNTQFATRNFCLKQPRNKAFKLSKTHFKCSKN